MSRPRVAAFGPGYRGATGPRRTSLQRCRATSSHVRPSSTDTNTDPVLVPKYTPAGSPRSTAIAWRSTVKKHASGGSPARCASQVSPPSVDRHTAAAASGGKRPAMSPFNGSVHTIRGSRGCTPTGNPNVDGNPSLTACQLFASSSERHTP